MPCLEARQSHAASPLTVLGGIFLALALSGCDGPAGGDGGEPSDGDADADASGDGSTDASDGDHEVDADDGDADTDGGTGPDPGPLTFVSRLIQVVEDRLCDLDGDGEADNVWADLGSPGSTMTVMAINALLEADLLEEHRMLVHLPWVEDRYAGTDPSPVFIYYEGLDIDAPPDPSDDFSGEESFWVKERSLDACGEPVHWSRDVTLEGGELSATNMSIVAPIRHGLLVSNASVMGTIAPGGTSTSASICGIARVSELGATSGFPDTGDLTLLEVMLAGGAVYGMPLIAGVDLDLDLDGDGLEQLVLDGELHIESCVDGDRTVISGRDCWADPRMADGISFNFTIEAVPAHNAGRLPDWQTRVEGTCEEGPPHPSLWDPT